MTETEANYVAQGYELPEGWTWERVAAVREEYKIAEFRVPVALGSGAAAWGTPMRDGKYMDHPW